MGYRTSSAQSFGASSWVVNKPAGTVDNDGMLVCIGHGAGGSVNSVPAGWTLDSGPHAGGGQTQRIYRKVAASEGASWTWGFSGSVTGIAQVAIVQDIDTATFVAASNAQVNASSVNCVAPSINPTPAGCTLIGFFYAALTAGSFTPPGSMAEVQDSTNGLNTMETCHEQLVSGGATGTRTATVSAAAGNMGYLAAIAPAVGGASLLVIHP